MTLVTIVVPTMNRPRTLELLVDALVSEFNSAADSHWDFELFVCNDSHSPVPLTVSQVCSVVQGPGRGPAANRNAGMRKASGEFVILLDDDCSPTPGWLTAYLDAFTDPDNSDTDIFEGRITCDQPSTRLDETSPINETGGYYWTCNIAFRRRVVQRVGYLDERFPYADLEDVEWAERCRISGVKRTFVGQAAVEHPFRRRRPGRELQTHSESVPILLAVHPQMADRFQRRVYLRWAARDVREFVRRFWSCRGRGSVGAIYKIGCVLYLAALPPRAKAILAPVEGLRT